MSFLKLQRQINLYSQHISRMCTDVKFSEINIYSKLNNPVQTHYRQVRFKNSGNLKVENQKIANRYLKKWILSTCVAGLGMVLYIQYNSRKHKKMKQSGNKEFELFSDPDISAKNAKMVRYKGFFLPNFVNKKVMDDIQNLQVSEDDIFVVSFPKSGTTWIQEIVFLIQNNINLKLASQQNMEERFPYLEFVYPGIKEIEKRSSPRLLKSHLPFDFLPNELKHGKGKMICVVRNPKDISVSYFHFIRMLTEIGYKGSYDTFWNKFMQGKVAYGPWEDHVKSYWQKKGQDNILFINYEDMKQNLPREIRKIARFLGKELTNEDLFKISKHCTFTRMKANPSTNYTWWDDLGLRKKSESAFMRKGTVGDWKNYCSKEQSEKMEELCRKKLEPEGLFIKFDI